MIADLLGPSAHLVGHSYGALVCLLAAALRPQAVRSLTVIEPPAFSVARDLPRVAILEAEFRLVFETVDDPAEFMSEFHRLTGLPGSPPDVPAAAVEAMKRIRPPWEADVPLGRLATARIPTLVVTGGHSRAFELIGDRIAVALGARRAVVEGQQHAVHHTGVPFNAVLEEHLRASEALWAETRNQDVR